MNDAHGSLDRQGWSCGRREPIDVVLDALAMKRLDPRRRKRDTYRARCPTHHDPKPSLDVTRKPDGKVLIHCFGGCHPKVVLSGLGLAERDLFRNVPRIVSRFGRPEGRPEAHETLERAIAAFCRLMGARREFDPWTYMKGDGNPFVAIARFRMPDGSKEYRPFKPTPRGWRIGMPPGKRPLYNLPEIAQSERVVIVEGEKCADLARGIGLAATTNVNGSTGVPRTDWSPLAGKEVVILPDNDHAGRTHADAVAAVLLRLRPRPTIRVVSLPGLPTKGDIADWLAGDQIPESWSPEMVAESFWSIAAEVMPVPESRPRIARGTEGRATIPMPIGEEAGDAWKMPRAVETLRSILSDGPVPSKAVEARMLDAGFSRRTVARSKALAGVGSIRVGMGWFYVIDGPSSGRKAKGLRRTDHG